MKVGIIGSDLGPASLENPNYVASIKVMKKILPLCTIIIIHQSSEFAKWVKSLCKKNNQDFSEEHGSYEDFLNQELYFIIADSNGRLTSLAKEKNVDCAYFDPNKYDEEYLEFNLRKLM